MEILDSMTEQTPAQVEHAALSERIVSVQDALDRAIEDRDRYATSLDDLDADFTSGSIEESKVGPLLKIRSRLLTNAELRVKEATGELRMLREDLRRVEAIPGVVKPEDLFGAVMRGVVGATVPDRMRAAQLLSMGTVPGATEEDCKIIEDW